MLNQVLRKQPIRVSGGRDLAIACSLLLSYVTTPPETVAAPPRPSPENPLQSPSWSNHFLQQKCHQS